MARSPLARRASWTRSAGQRVSPDGRAEPRNRILPSTPSPATPNHSGFVNSKIWQLYHSFAWSLHDPFKLGAGTEAARKSPSPPRRLRVLSVSTLWAEPLSLKHRDLGMPQAPYRSESTKGQRQRDKNTKTNTPRDNKAREKERRGSGRGSGSGGREREGESGRVRERHQGCAFGRPCVLFVPGPEQTYRVREKVTQQKSKQARETNAQATNPGRAFRSFFCGIPFWS